VPEEVQCLQQEPATPLDGSRGRFYPYH
jgi:hypothetical protein